MPSGRNAIWAGVTIAIRLEGQGASPPGHPQNLLADLWISCAKAAAAQRSGGLAGAVQFLSKGAL
jgi:hypothetical protein